MFIQPKQPAQGFQRVRPGLRFLASCVVLLSLYVRYHGDRTHRAEFEIVNSSGMSVSARYKGYYGTGEMELASGEHWHQSFRRGTGDRLYLTAHFEGQSVNKEIGLWDSVADLSSPGRPAQGEILLMAVSTNAEGKATMDNHFLSNSGPINGQKIVPEFLVEWRLMRP